ncbi:hypothetical protein [Verrucomicrobium spinosum]|uniref:hypothetical protein n=1 Tax=Verrucomicrobium spinosum TaxID=2736 RepID=UPI00017452FE|nr:hypothetical protein [Verrucomicrobium spinosum]
MSGSVSKSSADLSAGAAEQVPSPANVNQADLVARPDAYQPGAAYNFQPSQDALRRYLSTRKDSFSLGGVSMPGLFQQPYGADKGLFRVAIIVELVTAILLSLIVVSVFDLPLLAGLIPFCFFVGADVLLAFFHHYPVKPVKCLRENQKLLVIPDLRAGARRDEKFYGDFHAVLKGKEEATVWQKWLSFLCSLLIIGLAVLKMFFMAGNVDELATIFSPKNVLDPFAADSSFASILKHSEYRTAIFAIFAMLYGGVAYIHIRHTGWAIAAMSLVGALKRDRKERDKDPRDPRFICTPYSQQVNLERFAKELQDSNDPVYSRLASAATPGSNAIKSGLKTSLNAGEQRAIAPHTIEIHGDQLGNAVPGSYVLTRYGVLTDEQLQAWVNMQPTDFAKAVVALYGHKMQMNLIGAEDIDGPH